MSVTREVCTWFDDFHGARSFSSTAEGYTGWTVSDTSSAGTPTYASVTPSASGEIALTCDSQSEAQVVDLYHNDKLGFDIDLVEKMEFCAKVAGIDSVTTICMGLAGARNATADSIAENIWFRMQGSASTSNVLTESDDGTTDNDDKATGVTLADTYKRFEISFENGKSDVRFYIDGARVSASTTFDVDQATGSLQPFFRVQKASGAGVPALTIDYVKIIYKRASGA